MGWNGVYVTLLSELGAVKKKAATAVGVGISVMQVGLSVLPPFLGYLVDYSRAYRDSWLFLAGATVLGTVLAGSVREKGRGNWPGSRETDCRATGRLQGRPVGRPARPADPRRL